VIDAGETAKRLRTGERAMGGMVGVGGTREFIFGTSRNTNRSGTSVDWTSRWLLTTPEQLTRSCAPRARLPAAAEVADFSAIFVYRDPVALVGLGAVVGATILGDLDDAVYKRLIEEAERYKTPAANLNGLGEPLLLRHLPEMLRHAKQHGFVDVMFHTNGTVMTEAIATVLTRRLGDVVLTYSGSKLQPSAVVSSTHCGVRFGCAHARFVPPM